MLLEKLLELPQIICFEGIDFKLSLTHSGGDSRGFQLFYKIFTVYDNSPHLKLYEAKRIWINPFMKNKRCQFLWGEQYNETDRDLIETIENGKRWLREKGLLADE